MTSSRQAQAASPSGATSGAEVLARSVEPAERAEDRTDTGTILTLSAAHFVHDSYPAFVGVFMPLLMTNLGFGLAAAGALASANRWTTLLQPAFGAMADRRDTRWWAILPPATTAILVVSIGLAPSFEVALVLLLCAGVSHAVFHPAAGAMVTHIAPAAWGRATALFMTGGELGRAVGPILIAAVVGSVGLAGSPVAAVPGVLMAALVWRRLVRRHIFASRAPAGRVRIAVRAAGPRLMLLSSSIFLRAVATVSFLTFFPTLAISQGESLLAAGALVGAFELGGTVGALLGGIVSDRVGRLPVLVGSLIIGIPAIVAGVAAGPGIERTVLLPVAGFALLSASPVQLVAMQELLPVNRSSAVGITYFMSNSGAILATLGLGSLAQAIGLGPAMVAAGSFAALGIPTLLASRGLGQRAPDRDTVAAVPNRTAHGQEDEMRGRSA